MFVISLKSFLAKKFRLLSTAVAVMLGVAFLSGSLVLIDTLGRTFDSLVAGIYEGTDAQVRSTELLETAFQDIRGPVDESLLAEVRAVEGVAAASPSVDGFAQIVGSDGTALGNPAQGAPTIGVNWAEVSELNPMVLEPGSRPPTGPGEVTIDKTSAEKGDLAVGDTVTILLAGPPLEFEIVGVATFGEANSLAGASLAMFDTATAQDVLDSQGKYRSIEVVAAAGISQTDLSARLASALPGEVEVITGDEVIEESQSAIADALGFFNTFMLVFAGVALFVAAFIIYNTFSILVAQRTKEMALLRALGASGRQILGSVLFEALIVGLIASVVGIVGGLGVAIGLKQLMTSLGIEIPGGSVVFTTSTIVTCMIVGLVVTSVSAVAPALRAARTPPMAAIREVATDNSGHSMVRFVLGGLLTTTGVGAVLFSLFGGPSSPLQILGLGAVAVFLGVAALGPIIAGPVAAALGAVMTPLRGFPGQLAGENAGRNPKRTSATASALMIGIALVGFITIFAASTRSTIDKIIDDSVRGDIVIESSSFGFGGLSPVLAEEVAALPEVQAAAGMRVGFAEVNGDPEMLIAGDPSQMSQVVNFGVIDGNIEDLSVADVAVEAGHAEDEGLTLGDEVSIRFADSGTQLFTVAAIYEEMDDRFFIANAAFEANFEQVFDVQIFVQTAEGVLPDTARQAVEAVTAPYANATVEDLSEFKAAQAEPVDQLLGLVYALLGLSILIAVLGIANTLALSIVERTHEIGLLRAVGMTQRQVRAAVRWESVIIALLGTGLGIGIGTFFGWSIVTALKDEGFEVLTIPPIHLLIVAILGTVVGVLAAIGPARRAAKLNVLQAISTE